MYGEYLYTYLLPPGKCSSERSRWFFSITSWELGRLTLTHPSPPGCGMHSLLYNNRLIATRPGPDPVGPCFFLFLKRKSMGPVHILHKITGSAIVRNRLGWMDGWVDHGDGCDLVWSGPGQVKGQERASLSVD